MSGIDGYLAAVDSEEFRAALSRIRQILREEVPEGEECISYGVPTLKFHGMVASFAAFKNHCSFFPGHTVAQFEKDLKGFKTSRGTVQFTPDHPIPEQLLRAMIRRRRDENLLRRKR